MMPPLPPLPPLLSLLTLPLPLPAGTTIVVVLANLVSRSGVVASFSHGIRLDGARCTTIRRSRLGGGTRWHPYRSGASARLAALAALALRPFYQAGS